MKGVNAYSHQLSQVRKLNQKKIGLKESPFSPFFYLLEQPVKRLADEPFGMPLHRSNRKIITLDSLDDHIVAQGNRIKPLAQIAYCLMMGAVDHDRISTKDFEKA